MSIPLHARRRHYEGTYTNNPLGGIVRYQAGDTTTIPPFYVIPPWRKIRRKRRGCIWQAPSGDQDELEMSWRPLRALSRGLSGLPDHSAGLRGRTRTSRDRSRIPPGLWLPYHRRAKLEFQYKTGGVPPFCCSDYQVLVA